MASEIERKFLVSTVPSEEVLGTGSRIRQGYLAGEDLVEVRMRLTATDARLTVKAGKGLRRAEVERTLDPTEADELWPHTEGKRLEKVRHRVAVDGGVAEVDIYEGALTGLHTVEVEFVSEDDAARFVIPAWFGRELTGEPGWSNADLARRGVPR